MSRAFITEDAPELPPEALPRAPLPEGTVNYVTPRGLALLQAERASLEAERVTISGTSAGDDERRRSLGYLTNKLALLDARLASAVVVDPAAQPPDEVRFGAWVVLRNLDGEREGLERKLQIVGVDEANALEQRVAFVSPIARAILGRKMGEIAVLQTARGEEEIAVAAVDYAY